MALNQKSQVDQSSWLCAFSREYLNSVVGTQSIVQQIKVNCNEFVFVTSKLSDNTTSALQEIQLNDSNKVINNCVMVGDILISIKDDEVIQSNRNQSIENFKADFEKQYANPYQNLVPHVWTQVEIAKRKLFDNAKNINKTSIIISGPSGSGKTYACKRIIEYIVSFESKTQIQTKKLASLADKVEHLLFIQESFGNAHTPTNQNSSRFGNNIQLFYSKDQKLISAKVQTNLFQRNRVVSFNYQVEKSFHIFYYLLAAFKNRQEVERYFKQEKYRLRSDLLEQQKTILELLNSFDLDFEQSWLGQYQTIDNDHEKFVEVLHHLYTFEFQTQEIIDIFECIAGLIHLKQGNFEKAEKLLKIENLQTLLVSSQKDLKNNAKFAESQVNAFIIDIYHNLFLWIEEKLNVQLQGEQIDDQGLKQLNIYDSFSFEPIVEPLFKRHQNGLQQLLLNFINESLQQHSYQVIQRKEQDLMEQEEVKFKEIKFQKNDQTIKFYEKLLQLLSFCENSDENLFSQIQDLQKDFQDVVFTTKDLQEGILEKNMFAVRHNTGIIFYKIEGMLKNNQISINQELSHARLNSKSVLIKQLNSLSSNTQHLLAIQQLQSLMKNLDKSDTYFIKCVTYGKELADPFAQLDQDVKDYLNYFYENYQYKVTIDDFCRNYHNLISELKNQEQNQDQLRELLIERFPNCKIGKTLIFLTSKQKKELDDSEEEKKGKQYDLAVRVQQINDQCVQCVEKDKIIQEKNQQLETLQQQIDNFKMMMQKFNQNQNNSNYQPNMDKTFGQI